MPQIPAVSVVVGAWNAQRHLREALDAVLNQTFTDFEFIVVDDGSTDRTLRILQDRAARDSRLKVIPSPHRGIVDAANRGLAEARGELIARADSDDVCHPERFARQVEYLRRHPECVAVGSQLEFTDPYGMSLFVSQLQLDHEGIERELLEGKGGAIAQPAVMMRRAAAAAVGNYRKEYEWIEDLDLFLRMAEIGRLANLPEPLVRYRVHPHSVNATRRALQRERSDRLLREAHERRGREYNGMPEESKATQFDEAVFLRWGWQALRQGLPKVARRHAWSAIRRSPSRREAWKLLMCAVRGR